MSWWRRRPSERHSRRWSHPKVGELSWRGDAWTGVLRLEGNTTSPSTDIAIFSPEISDSVLSVLLAFQQQAEQTLTAARRALAREYPELVSAEAPALEDVWFDPTGAIELHFALPATWPDAMLRVRMLNAEVLEVQSDD